MPGTKRRAPYKYSEQQTVRSSHRPLTPWLALAGKPVNRCPRTTCAYSDCRAFAGIPSRLFLLSESQMLDLQFRQWGRVTGKDQRGEDGNELAKGVECGD